MLMKRFVIFYHRLPIYLPCTGHNIQIVQQRPQSNAGNSSPPNDNSKSDKKVTNVRNKQKKEQQSMPSAKQARNQPSHQQLRPINHQKQTKHASTQPPHQQQQHESALFQSILARIQQIQQQQMEMAASAPNNPGPAVPAQEQQYANLMAQLSTMMANAQPPAPPPIANHPQQFGGQPFYQPQFGQFPPQFPQPSPQFVPVYFYPTPTFGGGFPSSPLPPAQLAPHQFQQIQQMSGQQNPPPTPMIKVLSQPSQPMAAHPPPAHPSPPQPQAQQASPPAPTQPLSPLPFIAQQQPHQSSPLVSALINRLQQIANQQPPQPQQQNVQNTAPSGGQSWHKTPPSRPQRVSIRQQLESVQVQPPRENLGISPSNSTPIVPKPYTPLNINNMKPAQMPITRHNKAETDADMMITSSMPAFAKDQVGKIKDLETEATSLAESEWDGKIAAEMKGVLQEEGGEVEEFDVKGLANEDVLEDDSALGMEILEESGGEDSADGMDGRTEEKESDREDKKMAIA